MGVQIRAAGADEAGEEADQEIDRRAIGGGEQDSGHDSSGEQVADGKLGDDAEHDQQHAGRDQHAQHRASRHDADGKARRIAKPQQLGHGDLGEDRRRRDGRAVDGGEDSVGRDRCHAEPAPYAAEHLARHAERVAADAGRADQQAHQHEQRDDAEIIGVDALEGGNLQQVAGDDHIALDRPDAEEGEQDQRHRHMHAELHQQDDSCDRQQTDFDVAHGVSPGGAARPSATRTCSLMASRPAAPPDRARPAHRSRRAAGTARPGPPTRPR